MSAKNSGLPRWIWWLSPLLVFVVAAKLLNQNPPVNSAQTSPENADTALRSRFYRAPWSEVVDAVQEALATQKTYSRSWKTGPNSIAGASPGDQLHEILRAQVPVFVFTDDLEVTLSEQDNGQIRVDCVSKARIGRGDFGENRRHVLQFLRSLDEKLGGKLE